MELSNINSHNVNNMSQMYLAQTRDIENINKSSNEVEPKIDKVDLNESDVKVQSSFSSNIVAIPFSPRTVFPLTDDIFPISVIGIRDFIVPLCSSLAIPYSNIAFLLFEAFIFPSCSFC